LRQPLLEIITVSLGILFDVRYAIGVCGEPRPRLFQLIPLSPALESGVSGGPTYQKKHCDSDVALSLVTIFRQFFREFAGIIIPKRPPAWAVMREAFVCKVCAKSR